VLGFRQRKGLPHQGGIHGVSEIRLIVHDDEIKVGLQLRVSVPLDALGVIPCDYLKEMEDIFAADRLEVSVSKELLERDLFVEEIEQSTVRAYRCRLQSAFDKIRAVEP
jgi:hypothetical protein